MSLLQDSSLLLTPSAYKEGKLYSVIPSNGNGDFTATRATTATRVNSDGLVDLVPYNLVTYSEQFENAAWAIYTGTTKTANVTTAPNGTLTADRIEGTSAGFKGVRQSVTSQIIPHTFSVYLKSATGSNQNARIWIDTTQLAITLTTDWQRFTITATPTTTTFNVIISNAVSGGLDIYTWGAQLVEGTSARDYLRTETRLNIPRVDYSLGGCPNILLEPQRTNLVLQSSSFDNVHWGKTRADVTANTTISPSGVQDADTITANATGAGTSVTFFGGGAVSVTSGVRYTISIYAKKGNQDWLIFNIGNSANTTYSRQWFNISTGVIGSTNTLGGGLSAQNPTIISVGDGWYRCSFDVLTNDTGLRGGYTLTNADASFSATLGDTIFLWGAQLEAGAYATSFIPTTTASVTRNADTITRNNIFTNGLITAAGGTWFVEFRNNVPLIRQTNGGLLFTDASSNNYFNFYHPSSSSRILIAKAIGGTFSNIYTTTTNTAKIAIKWNGTTADVFVNGAKVVSATAFTATALENLSCNGASNPFNINEMALFPTPLTDAQMSMLTSGIYPTAAAAYASLGLVSESPSCLTSTTTF